MTLLSIVQDALIEIGLSRPDTAIGSNDPGVVSMISLANQVGRELMRRHAWQVLQTEKTFLTTAAAVQAGAIPADFDRFIPETFWNRSRNRQLLGPLTPQQWQGLQGNNVNSLSESFRQRGGDVLVSPTPPAGEMMAFEYVSKNWVTGKTSMTDDADTALIDENLIKLGAEWKFLHARGMDYAEAFRTFESEVLTFIAKDGGPGTIRFGSGRRMQPTAVVPDGNWLQ